jgi:hypothetical protein
MGHKHAPPVTHDDPSMRGPRSRDEDGELRQKRGDTRADTIEEQYGVDLGVRGDTRLDTLRDRTGARSVKEVIDRLKR